MDYYPAGELRFNRTRILTMEGEAPNLCAILTSASLDREVTFEIQLITDSATGSYGAFDTSEFNHFVLFIESDFDTAGTTVRFNSGLSSICFVISTFEDQIIEDPESFNVTIVSDDTSITIGQDAQVTIGDSNMMDILVSFDQISYTGSEGNSVPFSVQLISSAVDIRRSVQLQLLTASGTAEGKI